MSKPTFLGSEQEGWDEGAQLSALSTQGASGYQGLEAIKVGAPMVTLTSDEVTAVCPVTGQPDFYTVAIQIQGGWTIESKSLKLYFVTLRSVGMFCEDLAKHIKADVLHVLPDVKPNWCRVTVRQKARGGISIEAVA